MKIRARLNPGQKGTKGFVKEYGDALVCVRYRYDEQKRKRYKTIEIIVSESEWEPPPAKYSDSTLVALIIGFNEKDLQAQVKAVGGRWDKEKKMWIVPYGCIRGTKLEKLIHLETSRPPNAGKSL